MTAVITGLILADACPACWPGDFPAVVPSEVTGEGDTLRARYRHAACGTGWECLWGGSPWPAWREVAA